MNQSTFWTIIRPDAATVRIVAYGDSIFAGYQGEIFTVARRAAPYVAGEYLSQRLNASVEVVRRAQSGGRAADIYHDKILGEQSYMQSTTTRVVMFEMCGNDFLNARAHFTRQTGTCDTSELDRALADCTLYMEKSMQLINECAPRSSTKIVMTLYYPGYDADDFRSNCRDHTTGQPVHRQSIFLGYLARNNWRACDLARRQGFFCADALAELMGADFDSDGDGQVDSAALAIREGEAEDAYVQRISMDMRSTVRDARRHPLSATEGADYLQANNTHPTFIGDEVIDLDLLGNGTGSGPAAFALPGDDGRNPEWNKWGHERLGWRLSTFHEP